MKKVYSHENLAFVHTAKGTLELNGIQSFLKNEFHGSGGHVGLELFPIELWVYNAADEAPAVALLEKQYGTEPALSAWMCSTCQEENDGSFETCWKCQTAR